MFPPELLPTPECDFGLMTYICGKSAPARPIGPLSMRLSLHGGSRAAYTVFRDVLLTIHQFNPPSPAPSGSDYASSRSSFQPWSRRCTRSSHRARQLNSPALCVGNRRTLPQLCHDAMESNRSTGCEVIQKRIRTKRVLAGATVAGKGLMVLACV